MRVLVCGGRDYKDVDAVYMVLDGLKERPTVIIHGCASGADSIAAMWAEERAFQLIHIPPSGKTFLIPMPLLRPVEMAANMMPVPAFVEIYE